MLPTKTFLYKDIFLSESDFDANNQLKHSRTLQFLQNLATEHADNLGFGWDVMDANGLFWVLGKVKVKYYKPVTKGIKTFKLYTWPLAPNKFFADRLFVAVDENDNEIFSAVQTWLIIDKQSRRIASSQKVANLYQADFDSTTLEMDLSFDKIRLDESFLPSYSRTIRFCDLDLNGHVNNTCYIDYVVDTQQTGDFCGLEITYHKELLLGDNVTLLTKDVDNAVLVVGSCQNTVSFTCKLYKWN